MEPIKTITKAITWNDIDFKTERGNYSMVDILVVNGKRYLIEDNYFINDSVHVYKAVKYSFTRGYKDTVTLISSDFDIDEITVTFERFTI